MAQVRAGRVERLAGIFERHHGHLFTFFLRLTGRRGVSEDLAQEVFVRLLKYRESYRPGSPFLPWMWQVARHVHHDHLASRRLHVDLEAVAHGLADPQEGAEARAVAAQDRDLLLQALRRLDPHRRELLLLSREPGLSYRDLSDMLGASAGALKVQVHRALRDLKGLYAELQGGAP